MKLLVILFLSVISSASYAQSKSLDLTKGEWSFCVVDTVLSPYECNEAKETIFKFKRNGRYIQKGISIIYFGKKINKRKGAWTMEGTTLQLDNIDGEKVGLGSWTVEIQMINEDLFYSPQKDYKTVYWLFRRKK